MQQRDLSTLRDRLAAATGPDRALDRAIVQHVTGWKPGSPELPHIAGYIGFPAFTGSIDAAVRLIEHLRPGWRVRWQADGDGTHEAFLENKGDFNAIEARHTRSFAPTPALALCLALVSSMEAPHAA